jgi:hypothetical protein
MVEDVTRCSLLRCHCRIMIRKRKQEVFKENLKNEVFGDLMAYDSCENERFGGRHVLHHHGETN